MISSKGRQVFPVVISVIVSVLLIGVSIVGPSFAQNLSTATPKPTKSLVAQVGFSDPTLERLQEKGITTVGEVIKFGAFGHVYQLISFNPISYQAQTGSEYSVGYGTVLLYQTDGSIALLWERDLAMNTPHLTGAFPLPGDWVKNGQIIFAVSENQESTGWPSQRLYLYELRPNNEVISLLKGVVPPGYMVTSLENKGNGKFLLEMSDYRDDHIMGLDKWNEYTCCGPYLHRYFKWEDSKITDASQENLDRYYGEIGRALTYVTSVPSVNANNDRLYALNLLRLLTVYDDMGRRETGWSLIQSLIADAKQTGKLTNGTYVDKIFMPMMMSLYSQNAPFIAPDYLGPDARSIIDYYGR